MEEVLQKIYEYVAAYGLKVIGAVGASEARPRLLSKAPATEVFSSR